MTRARKLRELMAAVEAAKTRKEWVDAVRALQKHCAEGPGLTPPMEPVRKKTPTQFELRIKNDRNATRKCRFWKKYDPIYRE